MTGSAALRVIGIDPGPVPGLVLLRSGELGRILTHISVLQCDHNIAPVLLASLLNINPPEPTLVQIEQFVVGRRAGRSSSAKAGAVTRDLIGALREVWEGHDSTSAGRLGGRWFQRSAAQVKPWATDARLEAAGLLEATKGMRHAKDAARHALFAACHDGKFPDPLSKRARA